MAAPPSSPAFDTRFDPQTGTAVTVLPGVVRVTAPNASPYTFTGTNSFILGTESVAVLDPGPNDDRHLAALQKAIGGRPVAKIILTHTHTDHSALVRRLRAETGAKLCFGGSHRLSRRRRLFEVNLISGASDWRLVPDVTLRDGEPFMAGDLPLTVMATPGHCANHLAFGVGDTDWLFTGDHIMGWNSTLVAVPDGSMKEYLHSLDKVMASRYRHYIPAHGGPVMDGPAYARSMMMHRIFRNKQVTDAVRKGTRTMGGLMRVVYPTISPVLNLAARMTLKAHVEYLEDEGVIAVQRTPLGWRMTPA